MVAIQGPICELEWSFLKVDVVYPERPSPLLTEKKKYYFSHLLSYQKNTTYRIQSQNFQQSFAYFDRQYSNHRDKMISVTFL